MTSNCNIEVILRSACLLGEGPIWDAERKMVCWVDILQGAIHEFSERDHLHQKLAVPTMIGAVALCRDGHFIGALRNGFAFISRHTGEADYIMHPEAHLPKNRFNDGKCDPAGRFWAGTMALTEDAGAGSLYVLEKDLAVTRKLENVSVSNGLAWSPDHATMYYIDSPTHEVAAFDYDVRTARIENKRTVLRIPESDGFPDGMTIDRDGKLWIAHWDGWQVTRWDPVTGEKLLTIQLPVARVTSCVFGGDNLGDLYITSARVGLSPEQLEEQPLAGSLFVVRNVGFQGLGAFEFDHATIFEAL